MLRSSCISRLLILCPVLLVLAGCGSPPPAPPAPTAPAPPPVAKAAPPPALAPKLTPPPVAPPPKPTPPPPVLKAEAPPAPTPASAPVKPAVTGARLGMNLNGPADWNSELPFVDVFRLSRTWCSQKKGAGWGQGPALELDEHGWVKKLEADCWAEAPCCTLENGHYPSGKYTVLYEGDGKLDFMNGTIVASEPGKLTVDVNSARGGFFVRLMATNPANYVRNIHVIMPGFEDKYKTEPFHPIFLKRWQGVACFRFMDWMQTNNSKISKWSERPTQDDATWTPKGIPVEVMVDLCNRQKADGWFCMPHLADDDYIRHFAQAVKEQLDPNLKAYVEYSNEVWNSAFQQTHYCGQQGQKLGFGDKPWEAGWRYTGYRSTQIFKIWEEVFGGTERLVRVLASQSVNDYVSRQIIGFQDAYKHADALAIAPYLGFSIPEGGKDLNAGTVANWSVDQVLDYLEKTVLPDVDKWNRAQKKAADEFKLKLIAYEGGQHMVGALGGENNNKLTALLQAANAHPRLGEIYTQYLKHWADEGGDLFCYFSSVGGWSKWGSWGVMQFYDDDPLKSPKFLSIMRWAKERGQQVNLPEGK